ncbi:MAG: hypothetical protein J5472_02480 [Clostridia bacterium]|nr:hypothetical protein [Clostridia bacterium]
MKDEFKRNRRKKKKNQQLNTRFLLFTGVVMLAFGVLILNLYDLQVVSGQEYAETASNQSIKSIAIRGSRGMITDINSVVLAKSEKAYNVTFYRDNSDWDYPTAQLLEAIEIVESHGGQITVTSPLIRNAETGEWEFNFGDGISESAYNKRKEYFYSNNYLTASTLDTPEKCFKRLRQRFGFTALEDGTYLFQVDADGNSVVPDAVSPNRNKAVSSVPVTEDTVLKVIAINTTMQDNAFNSLPVAIAEDVSYETVSEIEGRSMSMPWVGVTMGDKRVYPNGSLAATVIGYTGKIQNADYYYSDLKPAGYAMNDYIGQDGIEASMESWLTANIKDRQGSRVVEVTPDGKVTRVLSEKAPQNGNTVKLTINSQYQAVAERAIAANVERTRNEQEKRMRDPSWLETNKDKVGSRDWEEFPIRLATTGVLIVMDLREGNAGNILALAQYPNYDLNAMVKGGDPALQIVQDERGLLMNYAIQTRAEPGSIFKMVTGLAALTNGVLTPFEMIDDGGRFMQYTNNREDAPKCWTSKPSTHKDQTIVEGLTNSCNYFFYTCASRLYDQFPSEERLYKYAAQMGLTSKTGIDLPGELRPVVGNQTNLYDQTVSISEQMTDTPAIVAAAIKKHLINYGASYGIEYDNARLDRCIKLLMDMAINTSSDDWVVNARPIFMTELNMTRTMVLQAALMRDLWTYLNTIKWGGSQEIQMGVGQSITLLTPITVVRYIGSVTNDAIVYNPNIVDSIISPEGEILSQRTATQFNVLESAKPYMQYILRGLEGVVDETGTAAAQFKDWKYTPKEVMYGKTGTSQVTIGKIRLDLENNGWFVAMCPNAKPEIAIVSFIPNGLSGAFTTRAARDFIEFYLDEKAKVDDTLTLPGGNSLAP